MAGGFSDWVSRAKSESLNRRLKTTSLILAFSQLDGYIARRFNMRSVFGTILDPAADKTLMTTLVLTLAYKGLLPSTFPLRGLPAGRNTSILIILSWFFPLDMLATSICTVAVASRSAPRHPHPGQRRRALPFGILVPLHLPPRTCKSRSDPLTRKPRWSAGRICILNTFH